MNRFRLSKLAAALSVTGLMVASSSVLASGFQLFEQDAASVGNFHAGYAAAVFDASTAFYNPAGLSRFKEQQLVVAGDNIFSSIKYRGIVRANNIGGGLVPMQATAQGGGYSFVPALHYVAPLSDIVGFGLSVDVPFGLQTNYGKGTNLRYAATVTSVRVIDISPVLSFKLNDHVSIGFGPDLQIMSGQFNQVGALGGDITNDGDGLNKADDTGYGMHAGILYEFNENSRAGLSYHSQVVHHLTGTSNFSAPIDPAILNFRQSDRAKLDMKLPPYTAVSIYHKLNPTVAVMGSIIYTQWNTIQNLTMQNVAGLSMEAEPTTNLTVILPLHFRNTFTFSVGADYFATDKITLRGGLGYDQAPVSNSYRNVQMPDNNRYVAAVGSHIQATSTLGFDLGWTHVFINKAHVIPPPQVAGPVVINTNGSVTGGADVLGVQLVWDMV